MTRKKLIVIQSRLNSTRFPRKVLSLINNFPSIIYQYQRISNSELNCDVVVAIPNSSDNDELYGLLCKFNIPVFRGHPSDLIRRYIDCAEYYNSRILVRVNGDCPLISPSSIANTLATFASSPRCNYASTILDKSFPLGEHCECFDLESLIYAESNLNPTLEEREHVTPVLYNNPQLFKCVSVKNLVSNSFHPDLRLCIDYPEDLAFIRALLLKLPNRSFDLSDIYDVIKKNPDLVAINSQYKKERSIK